MKKKIFLAIFLIVSMAVPAFSKWYPKNYPANEEELNELKENITKEFYQIRDEIFTKNYKEVKLQEDVKTAEIEILTEEEWEEKELKYAAELYRGENNKVYINLMTQFSSQRTVFTIVHELSHAATTESGHGEKFSKIYYKMLDEYLYKLETGELKTFINDENLIKDLREKRFDTPNGFGTSYKESPPISKFIKKLGLKILR